MAERADLTAPEGRESVPDLPRRAEDIRQDIAARRAALAQTMDRLGDKVEQTFDWRTYVFDFPIVALGVAAGIGVVASRVFKPKPSPGQRVLEALADGVEDATRQLRNNFAESTGKAVGVGATVKAAATALVTKALTDYLKNRLNGLASAVDKTAFDQEQERKAELNRIANPGHTS